jgi:uncharacterized Fe-S cluster protein YjdI
MTEKRYTNGEITVIWKPEICIHSKFCWKNLPQVFAPRERPWIKPEGATSEQIAAQVDKCPSGALSYFYNETGAEKSVESEAIVEVMANGPLLVYGNLKIRDADGNETEKHKITAFCRCGASANKPFCDGSHTKINFQG